MIKTVTTNTEHFFQKSLNHLFIDENRTLLLKNLALFISNEIKNNNKVNLNFICTDDSRKSQLAQVWSGFATNYFKLNKIKSFSEGTLVTVFYRNTIKTLQEVGFNFQIIEFSHQNPEYLISYKNCTNPINGYSKLFKNEINKTPCIATTTSLNTSENYLYIKDPIRQYNLLFNDPEIFNHSLYQSKKYLEINKQIAEEIYFIFKIIKESI